MSLDAQKETAQKTASKAKNTRQSQAKHVVQQCPSKKQSASNATKTNTSSVSKVDTSSATKTSTSHAIRTTDGVMTDTPDTVHTSTADEVKESTFAHSAEMSIQGDSVGKKAQKEHSNQSTMTLYRALQDCRVGGQFRRKGEIVLLPTMGTPFSFLEHIPESALNEAQQKASMGTARIQVSKSDIGIGEPTLVCDVTSSDMINQ